MKKIVSILTVAALGVMLASCGKEEVTSAVNSTTSAAKEVVESVEASVEEVVESIEASVEEVVENVTDEVVEEVVDGVGLANPVHSVASLEELNDMYQICFTKPSVMGVTDETFSYIDSSDAPIAQYTFKVNDVEYIYRCSSTVKDISGMWVSTGSTLFEGLDGEGTVDIDGIKGARWFTLEGQYCLYTADGANVDADAFAAIVEEFQAATAVGYGKETEVVPSDEFARLAAIIDPLAGEYQDSTSGRANLTFTSYGCVADIQILWGDSASTTYRWELKNVEYVDGKLVYTNCEEWKDTEEGSELVTMGLDGYFEISDGKLLWTGAAEENEKACVFEKMAQ